MAKIKGFDKLAYTIQTKTEAQFKKSVQNLITNITNSKKRLIDVQKVKLTNKSIFDGKTDYPHYRTGNMYRNLIDIQIDTFSDSKFIKKGNTLSYTFSVTNNIDGGDKSNPTVYKLYKGKRYNYAQILQYSTKRAKYNNYYERLQKIFRLNYLAKFKSAMKIF